MDHYIEDNNVYDADKGGEYDSDCGGKYAFEFDEPSHGDDKRVLMLLRITNMYILKMTLIVIIRLVIPIFLTKVSRLRLTSGSKPAVICLLT